jgi:multiple sugar transport system permease protein
MVIIMAGLVYYPVSRTIAMSFTAKDLTKPDVSGFVFFDNYIAVLKNSSIWHSFTNTLFVLALVLIGTLIFGVTIALVLNKDTKIKGLLLAVAILPWALPPVVNGILWRGVFHPEFGIINKLLIESGVVEKGIQWLSVPNLVLSIASLVVMWRTVPLAAMIFLAAMRAIPNELYESAEMDGCSSVAAFRFITLPILRPTIAIALTLTSFVGINLFDEVISLTGFSGQTRTVLIEAYVKLFTYLNFGEGCAFVTLIMLATAIPTYFYIQFMSSQIEYL